MSHTVTCTDVREINGRIYVDFDDCEQLEFNSLDQCIEAHADLLDDLAATKQLKRHLIASGLNDHGIPSHNLKTLIGKSATYDRKSGKGEVVRVQK